MMRLAQLRGVLAFALVAASIAYAWTTIENRATEEAGAAVTTTSTSTTTTVVLTTTTTAEQATIAICERSELFAAQSQIIPPDLGPGPLANLSLLFWRDIREVATPDAITEVVAIIDYYEDYLATAEPFEFDTPVSQKMCVVEVSRDGTTWRNAGSFFAESFRTLIQYLGSGFKIPDS